MAPKAKLRRSATDPPRGALAVERRREQVASFAARGFSVRQIAVALDVTKDAVQRDLKAVRPILRSALQDRAEDIYAGAAAELEEVRRELWLSYGSVAKDQVGLRTAILMDIASLPEKRARLGQSLGLVVQAPERVEVVQRLERAIADAMSRQPPEEAERLIGEIRKAAATR